MTRPTRDMVQAALLMEIEHTTAKLSRCIYLSNDWIQTNGQLLGLYIRLEKMERKPEWFDKRVKCAECRKVFRSNNMQRKYCCGACRSLAHYKRDKARKAA